MNEIPIKEEMAAEFLADLDAPSPATTETYRRALRRFFRFGVQNRLTRFTRQDIKRYRDELSTLGLSPVTMRVYMTSLRKFFEYLDKNKIHPDVARDVRIAKVDVLYENKSFLTAQETAQIIKSIDLNTEKGKRNRAMIHLSVTTGLLGIELSRAFVKDIQNHADKTVLFVQGKGCPDKNNYVILPEEVYKSVQDYLACRVGVKDQSALFARLYGDEPREGLKPREIRNCIKEVINHSGIDNAKDRSVRSLRDTAGLLAIAGEESLNDVSRFMRHVSVESTIVYARHADKIQNTCSQTVADTILQAMSGP